MRHGVGATILLYRGTLGVQNPLRIVDRAEHTYTHGIPAASACAGNGGRPAPPASRKRQNRLKGGIWPMFFLLGIVTGTFIITTSGIMGVDVATNETNAKNRRKNFKWAGKKRLAPSGDGLQLMISAKPGLFNPIGCGF